MNLFAQDNDDLYLWYVFGRASAIYPWGSIFGGGGVFANQWLTISQAPRTAPGEIAQINLTSQTPYTDPRDADRVTFNISGNHSVQIKDVEYIDGVLDKATSLFMYNHHGFTTDGSIDKIRANIGNQEVFYTTVVKDSSLFLGSGWDQVRLVDQLDMPGTQYWSLIRRDGNQVDAYSLLTGHRVRLEEGAESRNADQWGNRNYGEVEDIFLEDARTGTIKKYVPGKTGTLSDDGDMGENSNIDLRSDGTAFSDSFNLAYFNFIRYTSDNVWVGEATIHDGTASTSDTVLNYSTPSDRRVATDKNVLLKSGYTYDAPVLEGQLSVIGQSRNGTHDLIVAERNAGEAINGHFRLYAFDVDSDLYNEFNQVFLGTSAGENPANFASALVDTPANRVAMYGFGGNDILTSGAGKDYLFGGRSTFNVTNANNTAIVASSGNVITGGTGADYFGTGATNSLGQLIDGAGAVLGTGVETGAPQGSFIGSTSTGGSDGKGVGLFWVSHATDIITDWQAGIDTLVVLENGVTIIGGVRSGASVTDLRGSNTSGSDGNTTINLRATAAVATSDQDFDGARGGDNWDSTKSLDYIYTNQSTRDAQSIINEANDVTVVNAGLIVARGLGGTDTLLDSPGDDYLYGNRGSNTISLSAGGNDRVYYDTFDGAQARHYVADFTKSNGAANERDAFYLNKGVIDAFYSAGSTRALTTANVNGVYNDAIAYSTSINFLHDTFYNPSIVTTNAVHRGEDGSAPSVLSGSDGTTFGIGVGMFAAGTALLFVPFMSGVGYALMASGTALGAGSALVNTQPHQNATFAGNVGAYLNVLTESPDNNGDGTLIRPTTSVGNADSSITFLSFFSGVNAGDGYLPLVEFTSHAGQGIYGYFALHSSTETFVYVVASRDNLVTNSEAIQIAQIEGNLTAADFAIYDGRVDIYNQAVEAPIVIVEPTIVTLGDGTITNVLNLVPTRFDDVDNPLTLTMTVPGNVVGANIKIYDGTSLVFDGTTGTYTSVASGNKAGGDVTMTASTYDAGTGLTTFVFSDERVLGTRAIQTDTNTLNNDNQFQLADTTINYTVAFADPTSGIETYDSTGGVEVAGGNATIDGQGGDDILFVSETSAFLNSATDAQLASIESIAVTDTANINLSNQTEGFSVSGSSAADTIVGGAGANYIVGGAGNDSLIGANNNDTFVGFEGNDTINAGGGSQDRLVISGTSNTLNAALDAQISGIEVIEISTSQTDPIFGLTVVSGTVTAVEILNPGIGLTDGTYTVSLEPASAYTTAATVEVTVSGGSVVIPTVDGKPQYLTPVSGGVGYVTPADDATVSTIPSSIVGADIDVSNQLEGFSIFGSSSADTITAAQGNDTIDSGVGADSIDAGDGDDVIVYSSISSLLDDVTVIGGADTDTIRMDTGSTALTLGDANFEDVIQVENLDLTGTAAQTVTLGAQTNEAFASGITITTNATAASLNLQGSASTVSINATGTNNADTLVGGSLDDTLSAGSGGGSVSGGGGADTIRWSGTGNTTISGGDGNDIIDADADQTGADRISGDGGNDTIYGGGGNDTMLGGDGNDSITGEVGSNVIWGGKGLDAVNASTAGSVDRVIIVGDLTNSTTVDSDKLALINSTIDTLLGYDHPTLTNAYTTDVVTGETINFDSSGNDILYTFGDVDLSNITITGNYSIVTHSSVILNESDFDNIQKITFVGDSLHQITVVDDTSKAALSNDDQVVAFETWAEDLDGSGNRVANAKTQLAFTVDGSKFRVGDFDTGGAEYTFASTVTEELLHLEPINHKVRGGVEVVPAGSPFATTENMQLRYDKLSGGQISGFETAGTDFFTGSGRTVSNEAFVGDRFAGLKFAPYFEPGFMQLPIPDTFGGYGDNKVHREQFEVYNGSFDVRTGIFTVEERPDGSMYVGREEFTLILYDDDPSAGVQDVEGIVFINHMEERDGWRVLERGTPDAVLEFNDTSLHTNTNYGLIRTDNGSGSDDTLNGAVSGKQDYIYGLGGNDQITAGAGDFVIAGAGADTVYAGAGEQIIDLGYNTVTWNGRDGDADVVVMEGGGSGAVGTQGQDFVYNFEFARDIIRVVETYGGSAVSYAHSSHVNVGGAYTSDTITIDLDGSGGISADDLVFTLKQTDDAFADINTVRGRIQYDLVGSGQNDSITTGSLNDTISGGAGDDTIIGGADADVLSGGVGDDTFRIISLTDINGLAEAIYGGTSAADDGANDRIVFEVAGAANISSATISGIETLVLHSDSNSITMTAAQHNGFTGGITGGGSTDQITLTTIDSINASSSIEKYNVIATSAMTLGALAQNVEEIGTDGVSTLVFGAGAYSGTFTNFEATDVLQVVDGTDISGVTGLDVGVLDFQDGNATITLDAAQNGSMSILNAGTGTQTITLSSAGTPTGAVEVEAYILADGDQTFTLGAASQDVTSGTGAVVIDTGSIADITDAVFDGSKATTSFAVNLAADTDISGATITGTNGNQDADYEITLASNVDATMTVAQNARITNADGANTVTLFNSGAATGFGGVEAYVLADGDQTFTIGGGSQDVTTGSGNVVIDTGSTLTAYVATYNYFDNGLGWQYGATSPEFASEAEARQFVADEKQAPHHPNPIVLAVNQVQPTMDVVFNGAAATSLLINLASDLDLSGSAITGVNGTLDLDYTITIDTNVIATMTIAQNARVTTADGANIVTLFDAGTATGNSHVEGYYLADGANTFTMVAGNRTVTGGTGDDIVTGTTGGDTIIGGDGNDRITGADGADNMDGGDGDDVFIIADAAHHDAGETITGGDNTDTIRFTSTAGATLTLDTNVNVEEARITDAAGVATGATAESIDATNAQGTIALYGNDGDNQLKGNEETNTIYGGTGNDTIYGYGGSDVLLGQAGDDSLEGGAGFDNLNGGGGNDTLTGGGDVDVFFIDADGSYTDVITDLGAGGNDDVRFTATGGSVAATLAADYTASGNTYNRSGDEANFVIYTNGYDVDLSGASAAKSDDGFTVLESGGVDTSIVGSQHNDSLMGGVGNDTITGGAGNDRLGGGGGADVFTYSSNSAGLDTFTDFSTGIDTYETTFITSNNTSSELNLSAANVVTFNGDVGFNFNAGSYELLKYSFNFSTDRDSGATLFETVEDPLSAFDLLQALEGQLALDAGGVIDVATNGAFSSVTPNSSFLLQITNSENGNSYLLEAANNDNAVLGITEVTLVGVFENVTLTAADIVSEDPLYFYSLPVVSSGVADVNDFDSSVSSGFTSGDDTVSSTDPAFPSPIRAGAGNDSISMGGGSQEIYGGSGNDTISASNGSDTLYGGSGDDVLYGGAHANVFIGGLGADTIEFQEMATQGETAIFNFKTDTGDTLFGFKPDSNDKLDFSNMDADDNTGGVQSFTVSNSNSLSANSISWFYDSDAGRIQLAADTDGDTSTAEFVIWIDDQYTTTLASSDFIL